MAGIPPLAGFCGKFYVFFAALSSSFYILAFVGIFTSVISCFYYIRLIKIMYFEKETQTPGNFQPINSFESIDKTKSLILGFTLFFTLFFLFYPSPLFLIAHKVALSLI
jgi:NADH:ubiquinone oxidoreductase subunit 2 (subunit N)